MLILNDFCQFLFFVYYLICIDKKSGEKVIGIPHRPLWLLYLYYNYVLGSRSANWLDPWKGDTHSFAEKGLDPDNPGNLDTVQVTFNLRYTTPT